MSDIQVSVRFEDNATIIEVAGDLTIPAAEYVSLSPSVDEAL
jgi:hypothetical protein